MALMGLLYATDNVHAGYGAGRWLVIVSIYIFAIGYSMTWAIGMKLFASEIQPVATRATATSLAQSGGCMTNFFVAFITPVLLSKSSSAIYFLFSGALLFTIAVSMVYMPETRGHDLEAIREMFRTHRASDMPLVRGLRSLMSRVKTMLGGYDGGRTRSSLVEPHGIELGTL